MQVGDRFENMVKMMVESKKERETSFDGNWSLRRPPLPSTLTPRPLSTHAIRLRDSNKAPEFWRQLGGLYKLWICGVLVSSN